MMAEAGPAFFKMAVMHSKFAASHTLARGHWPLRWLALLPALLPTLAGCTAITDTLASVGIGSPSNPDLALSVGLGSNTKEFCWSAGSQKFETLDVAPELRSMAQANGLTLPRNDAPALAIRLAAPDNQAGYFAVGEQLSVRVVAKTAATASNEPAPALFWAVAQPFERDGQKFLRFLPGRGSSSSSSGIAQTMTISFDLALWLAPADSSNGGNNSSGCVDVIVERKKG
jgi:hypothetical protein